MSIGFLQDRSQIVLIEWTFWVRFLIRSQFQVARALAGLSVFHFGGNWSVEGSHRPRGWN